VAIMGGVHVRTKRERTRSQPSVDRGQERMDRALEQANRHVERATRRAEQAIRQMEQRDARRYGHGHGGQRGERAAARAARLGASIVEAVLADPQPQTFDGTVTILFSDIEGFTDITERLGDLKAQDVLRAHNEVIRGQLAAHGGHEVKSLGDSFMLSFDGARRALRCAIGVQRALEEYNDKHPEASIRVRIGLHTGEAIREGDDLFGKTVIVASRVAAEADGGEILVSSLLKELADSSGEFEFGPPREAVLKGLSATHTLYPVVWEGTGGG
jgi:class 3 adenylate cyclase